MNPIPLNVTAIPAAAYCKHCNFLFEFTGFGIGQGSTVSFRNNLTTCPKCWRNVELLDATYSSVNDRVQMVVAQTVSLEARMALLRVIEAVQSSTMSLEEARRRAEKIKPGFGRLFDIQNWSDNARATFLVAVATLVLAAATVAAPILAPTPVIAMPTPASPNVSERGMKEGLMSSTSQSPPHSLPRRHSPHAFHVPSASTGAPTGNTKQRHPPQRR